MFIDILELKIGGLGWFSWPEALDKGVRYCTAAQEGNN
jgi:hypothetical protein